MLISVFLVGCALYLFYIYLTWNYDHWNKKNIIGPKPSLFYGNTPSFLFQTRHVVYDMHEIYKNYKNKTNLVGLYALRTPTLLAITPDLIKQVLITNFKSFRDNEVTFMLRESLIGKNPFLLLGDVWKENRRRMIPAFSNNRLKANSPLIGNVCGKMTDYLHQKLDIDSLQSFDARIFASRFTADAVSGVVFAVDPRSFECGDEITQMMEMGEKLMDPLYQVFNYTIAESFLPIIGVIKKHIYNFKPVEDFFIQLTRKSIEQRQQSGITQLDYLDIVMKVKESTNCSDYESAGHAVQYFLDSFETTSISNAFVLYELGKDKRVQDKLRDEIKNCKDFSFDALDKLPYLEQVIYEALRLNPPLHLLSRLCTEPIELTIDNGKVVKIDVNEGVNIPIYYIHHDSEYYENPQTFYPERFDNGVKSFIDQGVLLPFSIGPRMCVGFRFGLVLMKYFFAYLLKDFEVILDTQTQPLEMDPRYFLNAPKNPIFVKFRKI